MSTDGGKSAGTLAAEALCRATGQATPHMRESSAPTASIVERMVTSDLDVRFALFSASSNA